MVMKDLNSKNIDDGYVHPSQGFWFSLANLKIPEELLKKHRVTLRLRKLTKRYGLAIAASSLITFVLMSYVFGRILGIF